MTIHIHVQLNIIIIYTYPLPPPRSKGPWRGDREGITEGEVTLGGGEDGGEGGWGREGGG